MMQPAYGEDPPSAHELYALAVPCLPARWIMFSQLEGSCQGASQTILLPSTRPGGL